MGKRSRDTALGPCHICAGAGLAGKPELFRLACDLAAMREA
jgi:hypothetical protein